MSDFFRSLGFPAPEQRDSIRFYFAKELSYRVRRNLILACVPAGFLLQLGTLRLWPGLPFLLAAVLLGLAKGYDSRIRLKNFKHDETWTEVPIEKVREIETVRKKSVKWDRDLFDITNSAGFFMFLVLVLAGALFCALMGAVARNATVASIVLADLVVLVVPFFFTGVRWALKLGNLNIKVKLLLQLYEYFKQYGIESESFIPMMLLAREKDKKTVPVDVKFRIGYKGLPPDRFFGLQSSVNINLVQGASYPYFYCVLVAKPDFGLKNYEDKVKGSSCVMCEYQMQPEAEVLVIRHPTTKQSGYFTNDAACREILSAAMDAARIIESEYKPSQ
jgi:hypothetical protein